MWPNGYFDGKRGTFYKRRQGTSSLGGANLSNNVAQISVGNFALGSHSVTATYAGDRNFSGSTSPALSEVVNPAATATALTSNANPTVVRSTVTFTATVSSVSAGSQSGTVNFYLDGISAVAASPVRAAITRGASSSIGVATGSALTSVRALSAITSSAGAGGKPGSQHRQPFHPALRKPSTM